MTNEKICGPWIKWNGGECPVPPETMVQVKLRGGIVGELRAGDYRWRCGLGDSDIVEYCVVLEQADLDVAEKLLRENGYTVTPPAKSLTFDDVVPMTEVPPKGTEYWIVDATLREGVLCTRSLKDEFDHSRIKHRMAYLEKEHALIAAKHIFGLKGGEL